MRRHVAKDVEVQRKAASENALHYSFQKIHLSLSPQQIIAISFFTNINRSVINTQRTMHISSQLEFCTAMYVQLMASSSKRSIPLYFIILLFLLSWVIGTCHATDHNETVSAVQTEYEVNKVGDKNNDMLDSVSQGGIGGGGGGGGVNGGGGGGGGGGGYGWGWGSNGGGGGGGGGAGGGGGSGSGDANGGSGSGFSGNIGHGTRSSTSGNANGGGSGHGRGRGNASTGCSGSSDGKGNGEGRGGKGSDGGGGSVNNGRTKRCRNKNHRGKGPHGTVNGRYSDHTGNEHDHHADHGATLMASLP